ncbi:NAD(P)-dependent oxidoreductase [Shimazuella alba]|uniref:NAD(P)-binding domain-containing protein n=1 Tax=Shimazuella alba TaxID=2690964 RepID=A0A6I4W231_9BACL|nr:NAD(P)-binding domain-containing protein [Shimazuella alba]MXQ54834.1 NAD(P)-binding domain-containing protein [Shimazuella alba]
MNKVTVIGLGPMGTALSKALLKSGNHVTIWNRTKEKAEVLVQEGAVLASSVASAIGASTTIIICVANYEIADSLLNTEDVTPVLAGRTLIQLSTGTPQEARNSENWIRNYKAEYLDGAIQAWPSHIGLPDTTILFSGSSNVFQQNEQLLKNIAGNLVYMGESIGSASAQALAVVSYLLGTWFGFAHGAHILESEGLPVDSFGHLIEAIAPLLGAEAKHQGKVIENNKFENPESSLQTSLDSVERLVQQAHEAGINADYPLFAIPIMKQALANGFGNEEVSSIIKILRNNN